MKYHLAVDSGGTKVHLLLIDASYRPVAAFRVGSLRQNTTSADMIERNLAELIAGLRAHGTDAIGTLCGVYKTLLQEKISALFSIDRLLPLSEADLGLGAAGIPPDHPGTLLLSGTGSGVYTRLSPEHTIFTGGYGAAVSDAGSGYDIGRRAFAAAEADYDGFGTPTRLTRLICETLGYEDFTRAVFSGVYGSGNPRSPTATVADAARLVSRAADEGDAVALEILRKTGEILGKQAVAHRKKYAIDPSIPYTYSGSVWQGNAAYRASVERVLFDAFPDARLTDPRLSPIAGAAYHLYCLDRGTDGADAFFFEHYRDFNDATNH